MTKKAQNDNSLNNKPKDAMTYGDKRRAERQEALREFLQGQKYIEAIHNTLEMPISNDELQAIKFKTETRLKLLNKVLPDLKAIEQTTELHADVEFYAWQE
jgi:hypothetical protein